MKELKLWWACQGRTNTIHSRMIKEMKKSGCIQIDFGVESGSNRILHDIINKNTTVAQSKKAFQICHRHRIRTLANLMIGLPTETKAEMHSTLALGKAIRADEYVLTIATPLPHTGLWNLVNPHINDDELSQLNFFNSGVLEKCNKSEVKELFALREQFLQELENHKKTYRMLCAILLEVSIAVKTRYKKEHLLNIYRRIIGRLFMAARYVFSKTNQYK